MTFLLFIFFILGAIIASFAGVVAARLNTGQSIARGRSKCDACGVQLGAYDLVPLLSYLASSARARCCRARLSWLSPLTELLLGALYALAYAQFGLTLALLFLLAALALILALVLYDFAHMILPPMLLVPFIILSALFSYFAAPSYYALELTFAAAFILALIIAALHYLSGGRAMGLMDSPLTFGLALLASSSGALAGFVYAFWIGAVVGIGILVRRPRGSRMGVEVPFAPFLAAGFLLALFTPWNPFIALAALL